MNRQRPYRTMYDEYLEKFPRLVTFYTQKDMEWENVGGWQIDTDSELLRTAQLVQDVAGNARVKGIDSVTGEKKGMFLYKK